MTKHPRLCRSSRVGTPHRLALLLVLLGGLNALAQGPQKPQGLKPSNQLRLSAGPAGGAASASDTQRPADFIVAVVNSVPITNNEVRTKLLRAERQLAQQGAPLPPRSELVPQIIERLVNDRAQLQLAYETGIKVDENAIDNAVQSVARQNQVSLEELRRRLAADGVSYSQFRADLRDEVMISRLRQREVEARTVVTEQDIDQFLREQEGVAALPLEINLAQILIKVPEGASPAQVSTLQAKAGQAAEKARGGADFATLVREYSDAKDGAPDGLLGLRSTDRLPPAFVAATQNLPVGAVAGPLRSDAGFHVLKVVEKQQAAGAAATFTQTHASHILLRVTPTLSEDAARVKLADMKKRIDAGKASFADLARENSEDGSAKQGGDLGWASPGTFVPEFEQAMNALSPGQVSDPVVSRFGVHLIKVLERREAKLSPREQRELARAAVREKKMDQAYAAWAQDVRGRAYVEYREPPQ